MSSKFRLARPESHGAALSPRSALTTIFSGLLTTSSLTMHKSKYDYLFKLLLIGDSGVGKSCLLLTQTLHPATSHPAARQ
ncbi:hypothetical protein DFJ43DRAFT_1155656 [Lentinula guzmanii]|uniref:Ras-domain-containing protein n=1 Tax=Lentinula guzmanii TaxID=2804957 RepID=A0AA38J8N6_9AGAR|nr:hypothetical protein DFJ43DRAFT_1155656 [Lentinula guzmanii]